MPDVEVTESAAKPAEEPGNAPPTTTKDAKASLDAKLWPATDLAVSEPAGAPVKSKLAGNVLVWIDAKLYVAPKDSAKSIQLANLDSRKASAGRAFPMHVVGTKGDFVEIETPASDAERNSVMDCAWFGLETQLDMGRWRLFVKRADLAPVIAKKHAVSFADGSKLELRQGVPLIPIADGRWLVDLRNLWVPVALPADVVGYAYPPFPVAAEEPKLAPKFELHAREVSLGDARVKVRGMFKPLAAQVEQKAESVAFPIVDKCATATVVADGASVRPYNEAASQAPSGTGGIGIGTVLGAERWYVPAGTTLVAEDGSASVKVNHDLSVEQPAKGVKTTCVERAPFVASRYVFAPRLDRAGTSSLKMCAPVSAVKHEKARSFGGGKGFGSSR